MLEFVFDRVENSVEKGEKANYQHFLLFSQYFQKASSPGLINPGLCGKELINFTLQQQNGNDKILFWT